MRTFEGEGGANIADSCGSCGADLAPSISFVWHFPYEDCRAARDPIEAPGYVASRELPDNELARLLALETGDDTRGPVRALRLPNGDLFIGVFPTGGEYLGISDRWQI